MSFIIDQTVIFIKLTDIGRDLLSRGELEFTQFAVGDSEIDYDYFRENPDIEPTSAAILRPVDDDPEIFNFIKKTESDTNLQPLPQSIANILTEVTNTADPRGVYDPNSGQYYGDPQHVKQSDAIVTNANVNGGRTLLIAQHPDFGSNLNEPIVGDYLFIKWANPEYTGTLSNNLDAKNSIVQLTYKIISINSGSLVDNNLVVTVDRDIPNFNGAGIGTSRVLVYPNNNKLATEGSAINTYYGSSFVSDFLTEAMLAFEENYDTPTIDVLVWNINIVHTKEIEGVQSTNKTFAQMPSKDFGNFVRYIERVEPMYDNIGVIHYTNLSPSNIYGEGFFWDASNLNVSPRLTIPHVMWHNNPTGETLFIKPDFASVSIYPDLEMEYMNLIDDNSTTPKVVGKVFPSLKLFIIEDQEILAALTYKSNRNWTLPQVSGGFNIDIC